MSVAIIMRSKDEMPHIERALRSLRKQSFGDFTLYNVDSGSTDGSYEVIQRLNPHPDHIQRIRPEEYQPGRVLNSMVAQTKDPVVVFLNADAVPLEPRWLEKLIAPIMAGEADATFSKQIARPNARFLVSYDYQRAYKRENIEGKNEDFFSAVACAFRRELWERQKFYEEGYSEDIHWAHHCRQLGYRFRLVEESLVEHSHNYTLKQWFGRMRIEGEAERLIYGRQASLLRQGWACLRELIRDTGYALRRGAILSIPYNLVYRITGHVGYYRGMKNG